MITDQMANIKLCVAQYTIANRDLWPQIEIYLLPTESGRWPQIEIYLLPTDLALLGLSLIALH